ncbi:hypothetical protein AK812_SmicGene25027 [Symbiodinium microadriaticum]|uniref:Uncharacterized protein n=1 Tax=Symbiodinium microadriaticum TaxID=2951 RepID=A0A1Q9DD56_SYMMI|nr:hypothetical protein AK812_SmicGene25027 [Symbiodinium microadriaticum]CAE7363757.1 unnamed protein product [Symbiodinium microadriaticum]CAE7851217.1 unnamed protein product [Symbiodinium sp. KB8]
MLPGQRTAGRSKKPSGKTVLLDMPKEEGPPQTPDGEASGNDRPLMSPISTPTPTFHREVSVSRDDASWSFERIERRPRSAARRKGGARAKNPFIEYDVREKRLNQERKWLQEDSRFLEQRREELRLGALLNQLNIQNDPDDQLYENRTFYGPHSMAMKAAKARRNHRARPRTNSAPIPERPPKEAVGGRKFPKERATAALKSLSQVLKNSSEDVQQRFKDELRKTGYGPPEDSAEAPRNRLFAFTRLGAEANEHAISRSCSKSSMNF